MTCPTCGTTPKIDGRAVPWRARFRLYRDNSDDPIADSDPERPADSAGATICHGLPAVAEELRHLAETFHQYNCDGLDPETLERSLKSLRPTLTRRAKKHGVPNATWRVPYSVNDCPFVARVDVERSQ